MRLIGRTHFHKRRTTLCHYIRNAELATDLNQFATGHDDLPAFCKGT